MENWLDACENRWLRRIMRIAYKDSHPCATRACATSHKRNDQTTGTSIQWSRQMRLKWLGHVLWMKVNRLTESVHELNPTGKRSRARPNKRWMDCIEENQGPMTIRCNKVWKNSRKTMNDTERHCSRVQTDNMEEPNSGING